MRPLFDEWTHVMQMDSQSALANVVRVDARGRRRYREPFKQELVRRCLEPGASVSRLSIEAGVNTNLLRRWIGLAQRAAAGRAPEAFLPVVVSEASAPQLPAPAAAAADAGVIEIELASGARMRIGSAVSAEQIAAVVAALR